MHGTIDQFLADHVRDAPIAPLSNCCITVCYRLRNRPLKESPSGRPDAPGSPPQTLNPPPQPDESIGGRFDQFVEAVLREEGVPVRVSTPRSSRLP
jgi:hypothetical protein